MGKALSPLLHPKGIQMLGREEQRERGRETNVGKWSERAILSKDIKSHWDSVVSTLTVMNSKTTQL